MSDTIHRDDDCIKRIQDALGTGETGDDLVQVARNAHRAEQELAARLRADDEDDIEREITRTEQAVEEGQARWSETGSTRR